MAVCQQCGAENRTGARFCDSCATPLGTTAEPEQRKVVTVLFCDVTGSTELGEALDPEAFRALLARYFERMKLTLERHGGTVEKFIGDAVMAVFGVPVVHEDDAFRAVRAALEMRAAFPELGVQGRIGLATGEVVTGTAERLATGDVVNVAARLEQTARPGEILLAHETWRLTRDAAEVEELESRVLKGKSEPVRTYRLLAVRGDEGVARRADSPMVGREREQRQLASVWDRTTSERSCQLVTILGAAGVGKSRLVSELLVTLEDGLVVRGRCLPYGEGVTYRPVAEILRQLPPPSPDSAVADTIGELVGDRPLVASDEEIAWAFRKHLEAVAASGPVVCVLDDLHWGEPGLLDLVEHVADLSRDVPILLLCMARPDLHDRRASWGGGKVNATTVLLEALPPEETETLIGHLAQLDAGVRARILDAAEGNPLFVEEMVALILESGDEQVTVPPTIHALLAARLDQLEPPERNVLQCDSVEGRVFHRGAVQALAPDETQLTKHLTGLVRKELIRSDREELPGEDAFRFRHALSRDAAYNGLPKTIRAQLHAQYADWLEERGADVVELDEMLGYHLERAYRLGQDLGRNDSPLADRAAARLSVAGRRALDRGDIDGACGLLGRAAALLENGDRRVDVEVELGDALLESGRLDEAESLLVKAVEQAAHGDDRLLSARAEVGLAAVRAQTQGAEAHARLRVDIEPLVAVFEEAGEHRGAADALRFLAMLAQWSADYGAAAELLERARSHARASGDERRVADIGRRIAATALWGPEPVEAALARCRVILDETPQAVRASCLMRIGGLEALAGRAGPAAESFAEARSIMDDFGLRHVRAHSSDVAVLAAMLVGEFETAEQEARRAYAVLDAMGDRVYQASQAYLLAEALEAQGRVDEAEEWLRTGQSLGGTVDEDADHVTVEALIAARRGNLDQAEELARASLGRGGEVPVPLVTDVRFLLAEVLIGLGRTDEARQEAEQCLRRYEAKGIVPLIEKVTRLLATISA